MKLSLRLIVHLAVGITLVTLVVAWNDVRTERFARQLDLQQRAERVSQRLREIIEPALTQGSLEGLEDIAQRFSTREHLTGVAIYDVQGKPLTISPTLLDAPEAWRNAMARCSPPAQGCGEFITLGVASIYAYTMPLHRDHTVAAALTTFHDASVVTAMSGHIWRTALIHVVPQVLWIVLITIGIVQSTVLRPIARTAGWMKDLRAGRTTRRPEARGFLDPISVEAASLVESLVSARARAEEEARLREARDSLWTAERLRVGMLNRLEGNQLFVVSNREPYEHIYSGKDIITRVPASGVVTALEPVLCACNGTWIAYGSGAADREVVDDRSRVRVPPIDSRYTLRRVWLSPEEERGYYLGFANEGLWPLCHIAYTRPVFRATDWDQYQRVNQKFAEAVLEEIAGVEQPFLLVQDYHFALLPRLIKEARPDARVAVFWHIPWPNPEAFGICPWQKELLDGLLGADIVSFHIQGHCSNFMQTIDRTLECRIEWERMAIYRRNHSTVVRPHPISVAFSESPQESDHAGSPAQARAAIRRVVGADSLFLGVGVDRIDYTKGIIERFRAIECFLEKHPAYLASFTFVQIGAPSRTAIKRYQDFVLAVNEEANRINRRFQTESWKPILLFDKHHGHREIWRLYRAADLCMVTSLHDGMNLVAKEFVSSRDDEDGVLILSQFAGASCELRDALLVNPYDVEQLAGAIYTAIEMPATERKSRMRHMRRTVREHNVYRWAAEVILDLTEVRLEAARTPTAV